MFTLNNTLLHPTNVAAVAAQLGITAEYNSRHSSWVGSRFSSVNSQLNLGTFNRPATPTHISPANGSAALPPTAFQTSAYSHPTGRPHTATLWELRRSDGTYKEPVYRVKSTLNLTSLPIPYNLLTFGSTYFWRATYFDADDHPSFTSTESSFLFGQAPIHITLLANDANTAWKYDAVTNFNDNSWTSPGFDDSTWSSGAPLIGFDDGTLPVPIRTQLTLTARYTYYFRKRFTFPADPTNAIIKLKHIIDDGCVIYVNGTEVSRIRMAAGAVNSGTPASSGPGDAVEEGPVTIPASAFVAGENVIAVEVHQVSNGSTDMIFGLSMEADVVAPSGSVVINEVMADNRSGVVNGSRHPDWIELYNSSDTAVNLGGKSLSDDVLVPNKFVFPANTTIAPFGYLVVWCDGDFASPGLHTGFGLAAGGQTIGLFSGGTVLDSVKFGPQAADLSIGRVANGSGPMVLTQPTPAASNVAQPVGSNATAKVNEWMATPASGDDVFELFNPDPLPVQIGNMYLSDSPSAQTTTRIPALSFIAAKGFAKFIADGSTEGANHCNFKLGASGDSIVLTASNGATIIDSVTFSAQTTGVSQGRLPDGGSSLVFFPQTPTLGESNYLLIPNVVINEALTASNPPYEDAIELYNPSGTAAAIGGWWLSDDQSDLKKYQFPAGTTVPAGGFRVLYENAFNGTPGQAGSFSLSSAGDEVIVSAADANGVLTGYRTSVKFGGAAGGVSFGRVVTSNGSDFVPQTARSFGQDNAATVEQFRGGNGAVNVGPAIGPIVINEVMYHPPDFTGAVDNGRDEFIELHNITTSPVNVGKWVLKDEVDFAFPPEAIISPGDYVVLVTFNPADSATLDAFRATYNLPTSVPIFGPYTAKLSNNSGQIRACLPDRSDRW